MGKGLNKYPPVEWSRIWGPLQGSDAPGSLHLPVLTVKTHQAALDAAYDRVGYDLRIDYHKEPKPPLDDKLAAWADQLLRSKGLR